MCRVDNLDSFGKKNEMCGVLRVIKSFLRLWQLVTKISRFIEACWERWKINGGSSNWLERRWKGGGEERGCDQTTVGSTLVYIPTSPPRGETEENRNSEWERRARTLLPRSRWILLLSEIEPARAQRVPVRKSGILSIIRDPSFEPCSKYSPSSPFTATNPIRAVRRGRNSRGHRRSDGNGKLWTFLEFWKYNTFL